MRISDWSSDVCSSDLLEVAQLFHENVVHVSMPSRHQYRDARRQKNPSVSRYSFRLADTSNTPGKRIELARCLPAFPEFRIKNLHSEGSSQILSSYRRAVIVVDIDDKFVDWSAFT